ncbi:MAG: hypothetical protein H6581_10915 [Bacteroidia bacterium]|nr:hypothetical protein [Bacteroidia bacterium]
MEQGKELFFLIKSLKKSEKRYFKRFSEFGSGKKTTQSTQLFDLIEKMDSWNESQLEASLPAGMLPNQLPVLQTRLFELILRTLRMTQDPEDIDRQLRLLLADIEILLEREIYPAAEKKLRKAILLAQKFGRKEILLELYRQEYNLFLTSNQPGTDQKALNQLPERIKTAQSLLELTRAEAYEATSKLRLRNKSRKEALLFDPMLEEFQAESLLIQVSSEPEFRTWSFILRGLALEKYNQGDLRKAFDSFSKLLEAWESRPEWIGQHAEDFFSILNNYLGFAIWLGEEKLFMEKIRSLDGLSMKKANQQTEVEFILLTKELSFSINFRGFEEGMKAVEKAGFWLDQQNTLAVAHDLSISYNCISFLFMHGEFRLAHRWLLRILNAPGKSERKDIREFARVFQILLQFELGNPDLQEYLLRSSQRYFQRNDQYSDLERLLITFFKNQEKTMPGSFEEMEALRGLQKGLVDLRAQNKGLPLLGENELSYWIESKLRGMKIRDYFEELKKQNSS